MWRRRWILDTLFSTLTNVNFSAERINDYVHEAYLKKQALRWVGGGGA